jgi:hypothetical protein
MMGRSQSDSSKLLVRRTKRLTESVLFTYYGPRENK